MSMRPTAGRNSHLTTHRYIVSLKERLQGSESLDFLQDTGFRHVETFDFPKDVFPDMGGDMILVESTSDATALQQLASDERVEFAEPDLEIALPKTFPGEPPGLETTVPHDGKRPNDFPIGLWGLENRWGVDVDIDAPQAWEKTVGSRQGPIIAVLDTGAELTHPDLKANLWVNAGEIPGNGKDDDGNGVIDDVHGYNAYDDTGDPTDGHYHGTHCAGTVGAVGNNGVGVVGVNWQAQLMPIKIFNDSKNPRTKRSAILRGISYATRNGARVTSNSWGGGRASRSVEKAFASSNAFHVMAAGNDSRNNDEKPQYPANYDLANSVSVASHDSAGYLSTFSNYGNATVDLAAPGSSILSTIPGGDYRWLSGTTMATPHVRGVAGLLLTAHPEMDNASLKAALLEGVVKSDKLEGKVATGGRLNANQSLEIASRSAAGNPLTN